MNLQAVACRVQIVVDHLAGGIHHVDARVADRRGTNVTRHRQQVVAHTGQFTPDSEYPVLFALRYELRRVLAPQVDPLLDRPI